MAPHSDGLSVKIEKIKSCIREAEQKLSEFRLRDARNALKRAFSTITREDVNEVEDAGRTPDKKVFNAEFAAIKNRAMKAENIVYETCRLIKRKHSGKFGRCVRSWRFGELDIRQIDVLLETVGSLAVEIQVKSSDEAVRNFYTKNRNRRILAFNPFHYGEDVSYQTLEPVLGPLLFYAVEHPYDMPYDWYYRREYQSP